MHFNFHSGGSNYQYSLTGEEMAGQDSFFNTSVGAQRGVPPLRLEHGQCAMTQPPTSPSMVHQHSSDVVKEELKVLQERSQHHPDTSSSETNYHTRLISTFHNEVC